MKYRLKNKELQDKLEAIDPEFGERLSFYSGRWDNDKFALLLPCEGVAITLKISSSAVAEVPEFDPSKWNIWPDVLPPKTGYYRAEYKDGSFTKKAAVMWDGYKWILKPGVYFIIGGPNNKLRFKPWDDLDTNEDEE